LAVVFSLPRFRRAAAASVCLAALLWTGGCREEGGVRVDSLKFEGLEAVEPGQLKSVLATGASSRIPWGEKRYFSREQFEADMKRIVAFYRDRGYPNARVTSFDVDLSEDQTSVDIVVRISEGQPVRVERVELTGFDPLTADARRRLDARLTLQPGSPLDLAVLQASREAALDELKENGHPYAAVRVLERKGTDERGKVIEFVAEPGPLAYHGPIEISGNSSVSDAVIRRQLTFRPGEIYRHSRLIESQRKLYTLEAFEFAIVEALRKEGEQPVHIPQRVTVTEGDHRKMKFGVGYGTEEKARVQADWRHVNFFGGARTASVLGRYSSLDRGVRLSLNQPYFFAPRYSAGLSGQAWYNDEPLYWLNTIGGRATVTRQLIAGGPTNRKTTTYSATYANEWEQFEIDPRVLIDLSQRDEIIAIGLDPTRGGVGEGQRSAFSLDGTRNTAGDLLNARRGYLASLHLEQAGKWLGGTYDYFEFTGEGRVYQGIGPAVLAVRLRGGAIEAIGDPVDPTEDFTIRRGVPFHKRYFLGGATSLRGWGRFDVAPLSGSGLPIGGHTFALLSTEIRVPVWGDLSAVAFLDAGNVWTKAWDFNFNDLRYNVGPGIRYDTPIGPLRIDIGYQLNPIEGLLVNGEPESRRFRFHFSIGQAF
jgi:outer membrane protein assembly complex protein YaeT